MDGVALDDGVARKPVSEAGRALFDANRYRARHSDLVGSGDPYLAFMRRGWRNGHDPHPLFSTAWYLSINDDVRAAGINPLQHFMEDGWREGRDPHPLFSTAWYLSTNPEARQAGINPVLHFLSTGAARGLDPHPDFDSAAYVAGSSDPEAARRNPLLHFLASGGWIAPTVAVPRRPARTTAAHLDHVVRLAEADEAKEPLGPPPTLPLVSFVVPVYNTPVGYLDDLLASFRRQATGFAELVLSDDGSTSKKTLGWLARHRHERSVVVVLNEVNRGIASATNAGVARASGAWVGLLDHDDALTPYAVSRVIRALRGRPDARLLYSDEVITDKKLRPVAYFMKPAWDPVLLSGVNYVNHLSVYQRDRLLAIGGLRDGFQGSQDFDLLLRYTAGLAPTEVVHLPYPAYQWRRDGISYSARFIQASKESARRALKAHFDRPDRPVTVGPALSDDLHRVSFDAARTTWPTVSVVIPSRDGLPLVSRVLDGLTTGTDYPALDITVVDNGSTDPSVLALYQRYVDGPVPFRALVRPEPFNFSRAVNRGVAATTGDLILLLNNDIEVMEPGWLREMVSCFDYPSTGIVGARLLYPDRTLQHAGAIVGLSGLVGHWFVGKPADFPGPMGRLRVRQSLSVVTGACMLVARSCFADVGPFDEDTFPVAYNDVDFCLRAIAAGVRVVYTPMATLIHHESASRGSDETGANAARFGHDKANLRERHGTADYEDRAFNPWLSRHRADFPPVMLEQLPPPR